MANDVFQDVDDAVKKLLPQLEAVQKAIKGVSTELIALDKTTKTTAKNQSDLKQKTSQLSAVDKQLIKLDKQLETAEAQLTEEYKQVQKAVLKKKEAVKQSNDELKKQAGIVKKASTELTSLEKTTKNVAKSQSDLKAKSSQLSDVDKELIKLDKQMAIAETKLTNEYKQVQKALIRKQEAQKKAAAAIREEVTGAKAAKKAAQDQRKAAQELNRAHAEAIKINNKLNQTQKKSSGYFKNMAKTMLATGAALFGINKLLSSFNKLISNSIKNADKQLKAERMLLVALDGREDAQKKLISQAQQLQKETLFGDEETIKAQALIAAFVKEEDQIKKIIPLVQDLATAKGMGLAGAADLVSKTLGSSTNALARYGIQVEGSVGGTQRLESLARSLSNAFGGQAKAAAEAGAGGLTQLKNVLGDVSENMGKKLLPFINRVSKALINKLSPQEKTVNLYKLENKELTALFGSLKNTNLSQGARNKLLTEVNTKYGKYLPNLLTEKSTLEDIEKAEKGINKQLKLKVIQQAFQEEINELLKEQLNAQESLINNEIALDKISQDRLTVISAGGAAALELQKDLIKTTNGLFQAQVDNNDKEVKSTEDKFKRIGELYGIAFSEIEAAMQAETEVANVENNKQVESTKKKYKTQVEIDNETKQERLKNYQDFLNKREIADQQADQDAIKRAEVLAQERLRILEEETEEATELRKKAKEEELKLEKEWEDAKLAIKEAGLDAAGKIASDRLIAGVDEKLNAFLAENEAEQKILDDRLDKGKISESEYLRETKKLKDKAKLEEIKAEKKKAQYENLINTLVAITKALPNIPLSIAIGAAGLANGIAIAAEPVPKFRLGTDNFEGGLADVHTGEIIKLADGSMYETPVGETRIYLPPATDVIPAHKAETIIKENNSGEEISILKSIDRKLSKQNNNIQATWTHKGLKVRDYNNNIDRTYIGKYR